MELAQADKRKDPLTRGAADRFQDARIEASSPGIPFAQFPIGATSYGYLQSNLTDLWEQRVFEQDSNRFLAGLQNALPHAGTGSTTTIIVSVVIAAEPEGHRLHWEPSVQDDAQLIAKIRSCLSLQMKELAEAVGVQRPTVYAWLKGRSLPQKANRDRLHWLYRIAQCWERICDEPLGGHLREAGPDGTSLVEMLRSRKATQAEISRRLEAVSRRVVSQRREVPASIRSLATKHGIPLEKVKDRQDELDVLTGKRFHED